MTGKTVVIVDDEPTMVDLLTTFLAMKGFEVHGAYNGADGLRAVEQVKPHVLLLDLMLPDIDGFEVCRRLRSAPASATLPIVIISARTESEAIQRAMRAGADAYMTKPLRLPELLEKIEELLG
jgi:DNA-binding response OmpR family regulator